MSRTTSAPAPPVAPLANVLEPSQFQDNLARLKDEVDRYRREVARIDQRVRDAQKAPSRETIEECTQDLVDVDRRYLKRQKEDLHCLAEQTPNTETYRTTSGEVQQAGRSHLADVQNSLDAVETLQPGDGEMVTYCQQLLNETGRQLESTKQFHNALDNATISIIETEYDVVDSLQAPSVAAGY